MEYGEVTPLNFTAWVAFEANPSDCWIRTYIPYKHNFGILMVGVPSSWLKGWAKRQA